MKDAAKKWQDLVAQVTRDEKHSEAHNIFRSQPGHAAQGTDGKLGEEVEDLIGIKAPGSTGVLYCSDRATANGWSFNDPEWSNMGQGAPEVGPLPGGSERPSVIDINQLGGDAINEYAPTTGIKELRQAVADYYNSTFRQNKASKYDYSNVCIVPGGRAGLTRVASIVGEVFVSYQVPEYTAYDQMLSSFRKLVPIPTTLSEEDAYHLNIDKLHAQIKDQGLSVVVASNPRNPCGQVIKGEELDRLVDIAKEGTTVILDEFYSWYQYESEEGGCVSAAEYIDDVNKDPVVLIDGLTKNYRLPGWRCCWVVGPSQLIKALGQAGSYLDGGASHVIQAAAVPLLEPSRVKQDRIALQRHFKMKRDHVLARLDAMGLHVKHPPTSTFYIWLDLRQLPSPLDSGLVFFEELLKEKVIVVPGQFFDISPLHRRNLFNSPCHHFVRLSFGPPLDEVNRGLDGIERILQKMAKAVETGDQEVLESFNKDLARHGEADHEITA